MKYYTITVNGVSYEVGVEEKSGSSAHVTPVTPSAPVMAPTPAMPAAPSMPTAPVPAPTPVVSKQESPKAAAGNIKIESPMPGKIISVKASVGQSVNRGDVILILEAMKMENEIVASESGVVASIHVLAGDTVESGTLLATLS